VLKLAPEEELAHIEAACLSTSEYADQITDAENRFVSDFVQGRLSDEEQRQNHGPAPGHVSRHPLQPIARKHEAPSRSFRNTISLAPSITYSITIAAADLYRAIKGRRGNSSWSSWSIWLVSASETEKWLVCT
jgi:hypothetical protein